MFWRVTVRRVWYVLLSAEEANRARQKPSAPAGWYPDPNDDDRELWWAGRPWFTT